MIHLSSMDCFVFIVLQCHLNDNIGPKVTSSHNYTCPVCFNEFPTCSHDVILVFMLVITTYIIVPIIVLMQILSIYIL